MFSMLSLHLYVSQQVSCCCGSVALVAAVASASAPAAKEGEKKDEPAEESDCAFCLPCSLNVLVSCWLYIVKEIHCGHLYQRANIVGHEHFPVHYRRLAP